MTLLLSLIAWWDYRRLGPAARRWKEYLFLYGSGTFAALLGALNDAYTVSVSPDYFINGKGLEAGDGLMLRAMGLGAQAGFVAGIILAGCLLLRYRSAAWRDLSRFVVYIAGGAVALGVLLHILLPAFLSDLDFLTDLPWSDKQKVNFIRAWSMHIGLYAGALLMLLTIITCFKLTTQSPKEVG